MTMGYLVMRCIGAIWIRLVTLLTLVPNWATYASSTFYQFVRVWISYVPCVG